MENDVDEGQGVDLGVKIAVGHLAKYVHGQRDGRVGDVRHKEVARLSMQEPRPVNPYQRHKLGKRVAAGVLLADSHRPPDLHGNSATG